ncbi:hypothetical protein GBA63_18970 [Rubrobacter tropicus]|uniref:Uncharacterized protein n=1 Tax=Rubrobacter tropicus TaxID=2653851 RepID=A0A6G8QDM0_9ACTN|nr:hypothetical protein [Rubrobacter tropicus]QIN84491.1 hypothetical protein GBA63_18970 [Rubrobacter tropicus]
MGTRFTRRTRTNLWVPSGGACAAFLLAIALLLCHGIFGAEHLTPPYHAGATDHVERSPLLTVEDELGGWPPLDGGDDAAYYATLLAALLLLAAVLGPGLPVVLCGVRGHRMSFCHPPRVPPPRGPTAPLLQVFRL